MRTTKHFRKILLATDGSEQSAAAADTTISLALSSNAYVEVIHVLSTDEPSARGPKRLVDSIVSRMRLAGLGANGEVIAVGSDGVAAAITNESRSFNADLVVVGSRGLSEWQALLKHSVSHQLLLKLDCPLLVVRNRPAGAAGPKRLVVAVAGGDDVGPAIKASTAAASPGSKVLVVHVAQALFGAQGFAYVEPEEEASETVSTTVQALTDAGISASGFVAHGESVADVIAKVAREWEADMIVTGSSRMGDLASAIFGSVSHDLMHVSDRPVLIGERTTS